MKIIVPEELQGLKNNNILEEEAETQIGFLQGRIIENCFQDKTQVETSLIMSQSYATWDFCLAIATYVKKTLEKAGYNADYTLGTGTFLGKGTKKIEINYTIKW